VTPEKFLEEFKAWTKNEFTSQIDRVKAEGETSSRKLETPPYWNNEPAWSPDGQKIVYYHHDPKRISGLRMVNADGEDHALISIPLELAFFRPPFWTASPVWSNDGTKLLYARIKMHQNRHLYGDIFLYDVKNNREMQLTDGARAFNPVFVPDGKSIVFGQQNWGEKAPSFALYDMETKKIKILREFPENEMLDSIAVSPDGKQLVFSLWKVGGYQDIYAMPIEGGEPTAITQDKFGDYDPTWSPDGSYLLFHSNRDGIDNIYAYKLADGTLHKVSNVLTGAYAPDVSPDGKQIAFVSYGLGGYELRVMAYDPATWKQIELTKETIPAWAGYAKGLFKVGNYNPIALLWPKLILPIPDPTAPGILFGGFDPLDFHSYLLAVGLTLGEKFDKRNPYFSFEYTNTRFGLPIDLNLSLNEEGFRQGIRLTVPIINQLTDRWSLSAGYNRQDLIHSQNRSVTHTLSISSSGSFQGGIDLFQIEGEGTGRTEFGWDEKETLTFSRLSGVESAHLRMRFPSEDGHWLALRYAAGYSNIKDRFKIGGHKGEFPLRGFPSAALKGQNGVSASLQHEQTLFSIEQGIGLWPIFFDDLNLAFFVDAGMAAERLDQFRLDATKLGFGAELQLEIILGPGFVLEAKVGIAQGLEQPKYELYWDIGFDF
jgi:Tol biopolymer transport system component